MKKTLLNAFRYLEKFKVSAPTKEIAARYIFTSQSRQQFIFNNKIETEQTEKLTQLQVHVQFLKHNMKGNYIKPEFEMIIRKKYPHLKKA